MIRGTHDDKEIPDSVCNGMPPGGVRCERHHCSLHESGRNDTYGRRCCSGDSPGKLGQLGCEPDTHWRYSIVRIHSVFKTGVPESDGDGSREVVRAIEKGEYTVLLSRSIGSRFAMDLL